MSFEAKYGGECDACGHRISPGQEVGYNTDDELVNVFCDVAPTERKIAPVCLSCFLELPASGVCGTCDD